MRCHGLVLLFALLATAAYADGEMVCNKDVCTWGWDQPEYPHQVEWQYEGNLSQYVSVPSNKVQLAPPDRIATQRMRLRVRRMTATPSEFSPWSEWVYGVPVGFDPDWDRDGLILPSDYTYGYEKAFEKGWQWPR